MLVLNPNHLQVLSVRAAALAQSGRSEEAAKAAAVLSLVIWCSVLTFGRLIGYYEGNQNQTAQAQILVCQISRR